MNRLRWPVHHHHRRRQGKRDPQMWGRAAEKEWSSAEEGFLGQRDTGEMLGGLGGHRRLASRVESRCFWLGVGGREALYRNKTSNKKPRGVSPSEEKVQRRRGCAGDVVVAMTRSRRR